MLVFFCRYDQKTNFTKKMRTLLTLIISLLFFNISSAQKYTETYIRDANKVGYTWWSQVNQGQHTESYEALCIELKERFTLESWTNQMSALMEEFGSIQNREVKTTYFQSEIEGLQDGFYVIIEYNVNYTKTRNHIEYLLLRQNNQSIWKIIDFQYEFQQLEQN